MKIGYPTLNIIIIILLIITQLLNPQNLVIRTEEKYSCERVHDFFGKRKRVLSLTFFIVLEWTREGYDFENGEK